MTTLAAVEGEAGGPALPYEPAEGPRLELDQLLTKVQGSTIYQRVIAANENFDKVMMQVNQWILEGIKKGATSSIITLG